MVSLLTPSLLANVTQQGYKAGLYTLDFDEDDMKDGDAVAFYTTVQIPTGICSTIISPIYVFDHGRFPQVQFGDSVSSVKSFKDATTASTVYLCFNGIISGVPSSNCHFA